MRPDIDAGPIGRKCSESNSPPPGIEADAPDDFPNSPANDRALKATASAIKRKRTRTDFIADSTVVNPARDEGQITARGAVPGARERSRRRATRSGSVRPTPRRLAADRGLREGRSE